MIQLLFFYYKICEYECHFSLLTNKTLQRENWNSVYRCWPLNLSRDGCFKEKKGFFSISQTIVNFFKAYIQHLHSLWLESKRTLNVPDQKRELVTA